MSPSRSRQRRTRVTRTTVPGVEVEPPGDVLLELLDNKVSAIRIQLDILLSWLSAKWGSDEVLGFPKELKGASTWVQLEPINLNNLDIKEETSEISQPDPPETSTFEPEQAARDAETAVIAIVPFDKILENSSTGTDAIDGDFTENPKAFDDNDDDTHDDPVFELNYESDSSENMDVDADVQIKDKIGCSRRKKTRTRKSLVPNEFPKSTSPAPASYPEPDSIAIVIPFGPSWEHKCGHPNCFRSFPTIQDLKIHQKLHKERKYACTAENCTKKFRTHTLLKRHNIIHTGERPFACEIEGCDSKFQLKHNLERHKLRKHNPDKPPLPSRRKRAYHPRSRGYSRKGLNIGNTRTGYRLPRKMPTQSNEKNQDQEPGTSASVEESNGKKLLSCDLCDWKFSRQWNLNSHRKTHFDEIQNTCEICGKLFLRKDSLQRHQANWHGIILPKKKYNLKKKSND